MSLLSSLRGAILASSILFAFAPAVHAQVAPVGPPRLFAGASVLIGQPVGEFADFIGTGFGIGGHFIYAIDPSGVLGLRVDGGFVNYGRETRRVCFSGTVGCRVQLDLETMNNIAYLAVGPQLLAPVGALRPYLNGSVGLSYFATESSVEGTDDDQEFARTKNFSDATFAWGGTAGLYIPVRRRPSPISIDLGVRYHNNGRAEYLREGDIIDNPDGSITLRTNRSETDLLTFQIGVSIGLSPGARQ